MTHYEERARLTNLQEYQILDTPDEPCFQGLIQLVALLCETPIALVTLLDEERLWFKAKFGLTVNQLARAGSFCSFAAESDDVLMIPDTRLDERFWAHPLVTGSEQIRFYAGISLRTSEGFPIGVLCVLDRVPRQLDERQLNFLKTLSRQVIALIECNRHLKEKEAQQQRLRESAKLATLGTMAASIVHEINNPLSILQTRATLLGIQVKNGKVTSENIMESAEKMLDTTRRIHKIINGVSAALGNGAQETFRETSLVELIDETLSFMESHFVNGQVEFEYVRPQLPITIWCQPTQISQVLVNVLSNAYDAVSELTLERKWVKLELANNQEMVTISISDAGISPSSEVAEKAFSPFFTTKAIGKGTGLGLSISRDIVRAHQGELLFDPSASHTTIIIRLPKNY